MTDQTAFLNLMKYFFARNILIQFIKLKFINVQKYDSYFIKAQNLINIRYFNLIQNFLFIKEQIINEIKFNNYNIVTDRLHRKAQFFLIDF